MTMPSLKIIGFCCRNALDALRQSQGLPEQGCFAFEPAVKIIQLPCSSKIETLAIIKAFESGADAIFVLGCPDKKCHMLDGNYRARKIVNYTRKLLDEIGIETKRLEMFQLETSECQQIDQIVSVMTGTVEALSSDTTN